MLNKFVEDSTNFRPVDGGNWHADEPDVDSLKIENLVRWNFESLGVYQLSMIPIVLDYSSIQQNLHKFRCSGTFSMER
jgi:hypothetical protein